MQNGLMQQQISSSQLSAENAAYVEELYEQYLMAPQSVSEQWRDYFENLPRTNGSQIDMPHKNVREQFLLLDATVHVCNRWQLVASVQNTKSGKWACCN